MIALSYSAYQILYLGEYTNETRIALDIIWLFIIVYSFIHVIRIKKDDVKNKKKNDIITIFISSCFKCVLAFFPLWGLFLIIEPDFSLNTEEIYRKLDEYGLTHQEYNPCVLHNDFVHVMPEELKKLREYLMQFKSLNHSLTGTGSSYFLANDVLCFDNHNMVHDIKKEFPKFKIYTHKKIEGHRFMTTTSF